MVIPHTYAYLFGALLFMLIWLVLFWYREDLRKEMLVMSIILGFVSVATAYYWWTYDWWRPATITGTRVGIEDFLSGFGTGGIMAVVYEALFSKEHKLRKKPPRYPGILTVLLLLAFSGSFLIWGVGTTSFYASILSLALAVVFMLYFRRDLLKNSFFSGALMFLISLPVYWLIVFFSPGWVDATYLDTLTGIQITGIPIEEIIFWFFAGMVFGPLYDYWRTLPEPKDTPY